jgi:hypothetical protein
MYVSFSVSSADFLAVLRKFRFQFFLIFFFSLRKKKLLCVCLLISFNFILRDNALVFCTQSLPATKCSLLHCWSERRALVFKCTVIINLSYTCAVAALYLRVKHTSKVNTASSANAWCKIMNVIEALIKDGRPTLQQTLKV